MKIAMTRSSWDTTIGEICDRWGGEVQTGPFGSQLHASDYSATGVPVVMPQDLELGTVSVRKIARVAESHARRLNSHRLQSGDIVLSRRGDVTRFAVMSPNEEGWLCGTGAIRIRLNCPDLDIRFTQHFLQQPSVGKWLKHQAKGVTMPNLNTRIVRALPFAYPPLPEQRRIAEILDKADALRAKRRAALAQLDTLTQSIFLDMFGDPVTNSKRWPSRKLGDLLDSASYGTSEKAGQVGELPVLRMNNITSSGEIDLGDLKYMDLPQTNRDRWLVRQGDLLFNRTNSAELVGKTAMFRGPEPMAYAGYLVRLRVNDDNDPEFVAALMNSRYAKRVFRGMCKSIVGMANINATEVKTIAVFQPPLDLQSEFAGGVEYVERLKATERASLAMQSALFASLQHRAFRVEL